MAEDAPGDGSFRLDHLYCFPLDHLYCFPLGHLYCFPKLSFGVDTLLHCFPGNPLCLKMPFGKERSEAWGRSDRLWSLQSLITPYSFPHLFDTLIVIAGPAAGSTTMTHGQLSWIVPYHLP